MLGRHIERRPYDLPYFRERRKSDMREPEIEELDLAGMGHEDVARFDIAMDDTSMMSMGEPLGDTLGDAEFCFEAQVLARRH